jgi:N-hydroxyarylamine O-acetyltransferase
MFDAGTSCRPSLFDDIFARMITADFPISKYLDRIGLTGRPDATEKGLREVHAAQVYAIPFENLDIHLGRSISLAPADLVSKLIHRHRGGYCFELNGLLHMALESLGFRVRPLLARVLYNRTGPGTRTHEVLIVTIEGTDWLADCGFGGPGLCLPIPMIPDRVNEQYGERFRLAAHPQFGIVLQKAGKDSLLDLYAFQREELTIPADLEMANHFTSTWHSSIFRLQRMCALRKPWGRVTLSDMQLATYRDGQSVSETLPPGPQYMAAIEQHFGIRLDSKYEDFSALG